MLHRSSASVAKPVFLAQPFVIDSAPFASLQIPQSLKPHFRIRSSMVCIHCLFSPGLRYDNQQHRLVDFLSHCAGRIPAFPARPVRHT
jgi:hypothetical protein